LTPNASRYEIPTIHNVPSNTNKDANYAKVLEGRVGL
jgi:hypothetical protein